MTVIDTPESTTETKSVLHILDHTGDTRIEWSADAPEEIAAAKAAFDRLIGAKKYLAYKVKRDGTKGEVIRSFDPSAEKIICSPQTVGG